MSDIRSCAEIVYKRTRVIKMSDAGPVERHVYRYEVLLPDFLAAWDVFDYWERERFLHMESTLRRGDVLLDVGAENGWISAIYAGFVGAENMVLVEPSPRAWPTIRGIWEANALPTPRACYAGLLSDGRETVACAPDFDTSTTAGWPAPAYEDTMHARTQSPYRYVHEHMHSTPSTTVDALCRGLDVLPDAVTVDVEGAELLVLRGATKLLSEARPLVWVSVHPDLLARCYGQTDGMVHEFMNAHGYMARHLGTDHEQHWVYWHPAGRSA